MPMLATGRHRGQGLGSAAGPASAGDHDRQRRLDPGGRPALAWCDQHQCHEPHRGHLYAERQERGLEGAPMVTRLSASSIPRRCRCGRPPRKRWTLCWRHHGNGPKATTAQPDNEMLIVSKGRRKNLNQPHLATSTSQRVLSAKMHSCPLVRQQDRFNAFPTQRQSVVAALHTTHCAA
jgi:hypothetical protein